jgi:hypothetical protein
MILVRLRLPQRGAEMPGHSGDVIPLMLIEVGSSDQV